MTYSDHYSESEHYQPRNATDSQVIIASVFLGAIIGAYFLYTTLELRGYPARLWVHNMVDMSVGVLRLRGHRLSDSESSDDDDTMQRGGMLDSLLGLSPTNLLQKGVRGMASAFSTGPSNVPPGLGNLNNSCYQNSVIQGLASLPSLREYLSKTTSEHTLSPATTNGALFEIIRNLNNPDNKGQHFWIRGKLKSMSTFEQQDAQEYYSKILDALDEEVKKVSSSKRRTSVSWLEATKSLSGSGVDAQAGETENDTRSGGAEEAVHRRDAENDVQKGEELGAKTLRTPLNQSKITPNPLEGRLAQRVGCTSCGYSEGLTLIPFNCVTVSLGRSYSYDIRECLDEYTTLEYIDGVECAKCTLLKLQNTLAPLAAKNPGSPFVEKLHAVQKALDEEDFEDKTLIKTLNVNKKNWVQSTKSKQAVIAQVPQSLVLHVNRSGFNENTGMPFKNNAGVSYPRILDLGNWCLSSTEWPRDPRESMLSGGTPITDSPFHYRLQAAVTHYGSHGNGHYVCYRPHPRVIGSEGSQTPSTEDEPHEAIQAEQSEQWWRFSDDSVHSVSEKDAHQGNVFMLFYERIDESTPSPPQATDAVERSTSVLEDVPFPPATLNTLMAVDDEAVNTALPDDDDGLLDIMPLELSPTVQRTLPESSQAPLSAQSPPDAPPTIDVGTGPLPDAPLDIEPETSNAEPANITLPDSNLNDDLNKLIPPESRPTSQPTTHLDPTQAPPPAQVPRDAPPSTIAFSDAQLHTEPETSDAESVDAPSTMLTSDYESEADIPTPPVALKLVPQASPHLMRTAGTAESRGHRESLPLVSAT
ncbi:cysteine proteinase [Clathrospora elynae]|uniref:ubiquitinyl hydrolase 1 n=1 Tax=Clathrospora elynae TaxID=706981 RepID=A0A6A5SFQ1_9PLEO|nr:cysteine proteinase [Clathrospora elynae]